MCRFRQSRQNLVLLSAVSTNSTRVFFIQIKNFLLGTTHVQFAPRGTFRSGFAHAKKEVRHDPNKPPSHGTDVHGQDDCRERLDHAAREKARAPGSECLRQSIPRPSFFALAAQVDLAEKAFHDAVARRNEAQIAYLREPSIIAQVAFEDAKTAEAVALEILDAEIRWLASTRATTVNGLKLKASYACTVGKLADRIVEDILQL